MVAEISVIFLIINLSNFVQFKQYQSKSRPRRTTRYFVQSKIFTFHYTWGKSLGLFFCDFAFSKREFPAVLI